jgi:prepilin-type N-terminal cleavage/methylation domain-containing protein
MRKGGGRSPCTLGRVQISQGFSIIEVTVALALVAIVLTAAWGWQGSVAKRRLQNAAYLLEADLRWAQQMAVANGGSGPQVEVCFRSDGYDIYSTVYSGGDVLNIDPTNYIPTVGSRFKSANSGQEYATGIQLVPPNVGTVPCTLDATRVAVAFRASGQPIFTDGSPHAVTVALRGHSYLVTIQPFTGLAAVSAQ